MRTPKNLTADERQMFVRLKKQLARQRILEGLRADVLGDYVRLSTVVDVLSGELDVAEKEQKVSISARLTIAIAQRDRLGQRIFDDA